jgi:membrane-associated phospholipid phosphatase
LVAGYLVLTAPLAFLAGAGALGFADAAAHVVVASALIGFATRGRASRGGGARVLTDWAPLLLVPLLYLELPLLMEGMPGPVRYHDPWAAALDQRLFGMQPAYAWAGAWPSPLLSEALHACYFSYYLIIYLPPLLLYLGPARRGGSEVGSAFEEIVLAVTISFLICFVVFVVMPVQGPRYLGVPAGVPDGPVRRLVLAVLESGSSRGAAFPSSHVSVSVTQALMALRHQPRVARWCLPVALGLGAGAVYGGFHYGVDVLVGAAVGVLAALSAARLPRRLLGRIRGFTSPRI